MSNADTIKTNGTPLNKSYEIMNGDLQCQLQNADDGQQTNTSKNQHQQNCNTQPEHNYAQKISRKCHSKNIFPLRILMPMMYQQNILVNLIR